MGLSPTELQQHVENLDNLLKALLGSDNVYFQPPDDITMLYPAIVYNLDFESVSRADNVAYARKMRWSVTLISSDPMDPVREALADLPMCSFERAFPADRLNHQVFNLFY